MLMIEHKMKKKETVERSIMTLEERIQRLEDGLWEIWQLNI